MSFIIAVALFASAFQVSDASELREQRTPLPVGTANSTPQPSGLNSARDWIALLDNQRWEDSWDKAAAIFQARISAAQWASQAQSVRQPLGTVSERAFKDAKEATSLPGAPTGQYEIIQFQTNFTHKANAIETIVLMRDAADWKVAGYFIR